jgi:hypothetical protein
VAHVGLDAMCDQQFFVDVECLKANGGELIVKELSILEYRTDKVSTFHLFSPPWVRECDFEEKTVATNDYLWQFRHGFRWNTGVTQYYRMNFIFKSLFSKTCTVYVKGTDKLNMIRRIVRNDKHVVFVELGKLGCPKFDLSTLHCKNDKCLLFSQNKHHKYCAESKVRFFADWFRSG